MLHSLRLWIAPNRKKKYTLRTVSKLSTKKNNPSITVDCARLPTRPSAAQQRSHFAITYACTANISPSADNERAQSETMKMRCAESSEREFIVCACVHFGRVSKLLQADARPQEAREEREREWRERGLVSEKKVGIPTVKRRPAKTSKARRAACITVICLYFTRMVPGRRATRSPRSAR